MHCDLCRRLISEEDTHELVLCLQCKQTEDKEHCIRCKAMFFANTDVGKLFATVKVFLAKYVKPAAITLLFVSVIAAIAYKLGLLKFAGLGVLALLALALSLTIPAYIFYLIGYGSIWLIYGHDEVRNLNMEKRLQLIFPGVSVVLVPSVAIWVLSILGHCAIWLVNGHHW